MDSTSQVGRYQVQKVLGQGAMGVVYLAHDPQIGRDVALKTVRPMEGTRAEEKEEIRVRFLREAQAAGKLLHPNIVTIFDVFEDRGTLYIAMEYVEGVLLDTYCAQRNLLRVDQVAALADQGLAALDYAHRHAIVHRDIKPGNLMVVEGRTLKVMDFGLARQSGAHLTQTGTVIGTPHYMSPEQIEGRPLDGRSDLFSMGVVLYELVTGERPFQGDSISTVVYRVVHTDPTPPRQVNPKVPAALEAVILKAMAKSPSDRFQSAAAFREALRAALAPEAEHEWSLFEPTLQQPMPALEPVLPPPPSSGLLRKRRHHFSWKWAWAALAVAVLVAGAWGAWSTWWGGPGRRPGVVPPPSQEELPVPLDVRTDPPGAHLFLDGQAVEAVTLPPHDSGPHTLEARLGCLAAKAAVSARERGAPIRLKLEPRPFVFKVSSNPPGADVVVDGEDTGLRTPASIARGGCSPFKIKLALEGYDPFDAEVQPDRQSELAATLVETPPEGALRVLSASGILRVYDGSRLLGTSDRILQLPSGDHTLTVADPAVRGSRQEKVTIRPGATATLRVPAFETGQVFLYARPANDGKVMVDGSYLEELPLNGTTPLAAGRHEFQVVSPGGRRVRFTWDIRAGQQTRVVDFDTGKVETP